MEELINQLKTFFGDRSKNIFKTGPAEIEIVISDYEDAAQLATELKAHIIKIIDENSIAKINIVNEGGDLVDSFSLNQ